MIIKKGDKVKILTGKDKKKDGDVIEIILTDHASQRTVRFSSGSTGRKPLDQRHSGPVRSR